MLLPGETLPRAQLTQQVLTENKVKTKFEPALIRRGSDILKAMTGETLSRMVMYGTEKLGNRTWVGGGAWNFLSKSYSRLAPLLFACPLPRLLLAPHCRVDSTPAHREILCFAPWVLRPICVEQTKRLLSSRAEF